MTVYISEQNGTGTTVKSNPVMQVYRTGIRLPKYGNSPFGE